MNDSKNRKHIDAELLAQTGFTEKSIQKSKWVSRWVVAITIAAGLVVGLSLLNQDNATALTLPDQDDVLCERIMLEATILEPNWTSLEASVFAVVRGIDSTANDWAVSNAAHSATNFLRQRVFGSPLEYLAFVMSAGMVATPPHIDPDAAGSLQGALERISYGREDHNRAHRLLCQPATGRPYIAAAMGTIFEPPVLGVTRSDDINSDAAESLGVDGSLPSFLWHTSGVASGTREFCTIAESNGTPFSSDHRAIGIGFLLQFADGSRCPVHILVAPAQSGDEWVVVGYWRFAACDSSGLDGASMSF